MTSTQKTIKYIATAFAIFLVVTIIYAILTGGYALLNGLGLINTNNAVITENLKTISSDIAEISSLKIDLAYTNLYIKAGEKFEVQTNNNKITFENNNGSVKIKEESKYLLSSKNMESNLIVYIPENMMIIDETNIDAGAGKINIEKLNTKGLYLELGAGEVYIEKTIATDETSIEGGVGKTELKQCELNNLNADLGVGEFKFSGTLTGKNDINSGIGATSLNLAGEKEDYTINASKGLGNITLEGKKVESDKVYGNGKNHLDIDGGIGEIKIDFNNIEQNQTTTDLPTENVTIEVLEDTITNKTVEIMITDNNKKQYGWGVEFRVQQNVNGEWKELEYILDDLSWIEIAYKLDKNNQVKMKVNFEKYYGTLKSGTYRIVKPVYDNGYIDLYSNEFEIK